MVDIQWVNSMHKNHKNKYLSSDIMEEYRKRARELPNNNGQIIGEKRKLCIELMTEYGLLEGEATNILNGHSTNDYLNKYYRIENKIPIERKSRKEYTQGDEDEEDW